MLNFLCYKNPTNISSDKLSLSQHRKKGAFSLWYIGTEPKIARERP